MDMLTDLFDRVYVINCPHRTDRLQSLEDNIKATGIADCSKMHVFAGVRGELSPPPKYWGASVGAWGCFQSHRRLVEDVLNEDNDSIDSILILEDDACFPETALKRVNEFMQNVPDDWDQLYLGGQHRVKPIETETEGILRGISINRAHAYALNCKVYKKFYSHINYSPNYYGKKNHHFDHQLEIAHRKQDWNVYCPSVWLAGQCAGKSDICSDHLESRIWQ